MNDTPKKQPEEVKTDFRIDRVTEPRSGFVISIATDSHTARALVPDDMMRQIHDWLAAQLPSEAGDTDTPAEGLPKMSGIEKV